MNFLVVVCQALNCTRLDLLTRPILQGSSKPAKNLPLAGGLPQQDPNSLVVSTFGVLLTNKWYSIQVISFVNSWKNKEFRSISIYPHSLSIFSKCNSVCGDRVIPTDVQSCLSVQVSLQSCDFLPKYYIYGVTMEQLHHTWHHPVTLQGDLPHLLKAQEWHLKQNLGGVLLNGCGLTCRLLGSSVSPWWHDCNFTLCVVYIYLCADK